MANTRVRRPLVGVERTGRHRTLSVRSRIVVSILAVAALGLAASGVASYLVQREGVLLGVDAHLLRTVPDLKEIASGSTSSGATGTSPGTDGTPAPTPTAAPTDPAGAPTPAPTTTPTPTPTPAATDPTDPSTDAPTPLASVDAILRVAMKQVIPAANESVLGLIDGQPALVPAAKLPFRLDENAAFVARVLAEAHPSQVVIGTMVGADRTLRYLIVPVSAAGDPSSGLYVAAFDLDAELGMVAESFHTFLRVALAALVVVGLVAWVVAGRLLRPIRLLRDAATASSNAADLTERVPVTGRDDVSELATAINGMFDRLQSSSMSQRRLMDDIGHELKTPITIIRGHLELLDPANADEVAATRELAIDELDRMSRLVSEISLLASSSAPNFVELVEVDIESLTAFVGTKASALDPARTWRTESSAVFARIDSRRITQAWLQLADNAVKYSTPGTPISITSEAVETPEGPRLNLSVGDEGPGISDDLQDRIFERFRRLETHRTVPGSGLGLSIVSAIAEAHGGRVLLASAPGTGSVFTISLPLSTTAGNPTTAATPGALSPAEA